MPNRGRNSKAYDSCADHLMPVIVIALFTGMGKSKILKLKWEDIGFKQRIIFVRDSKSN
jgi:integrase